MQGLPKVLETLSVLDVLESVLILMEVLLHPYTVVGILLVSVLEPIS